MYFAPILTSWFCRFGTGCIVRNGEWRIFVNYSVFSALFPLKLRILFEECILDTPVQKDAVPPIFISHYHRSKPNSTTTDLCIELPFLLLTKVLFQTSFTSFQYNTEGRRLSNYSIKLILCSRHRSRCKGLCVKIKSMNLTNIQRDVIFLQHIWPLKETTLFLL